MRRFHHDGIAVSSLTAVANDAGVPPGNVFYYFRSKEALTDEVIERWCALVKQSLDDVAIGTAALDRIRNFILSAAQRRQGYAEFGCPLAALGNDLRNASPAISNSSGRPLAMIRAWLNAEFLLLFDADESQDNADFCLASLQGSFALAHAAGDPQIVSRTVAHLLDWIDTVSLERI